MSGRPPFHVLAKPIGPICNLRCRYCFYLEKTALFPGERSWRMDPGLLERFVEDYIASQDGPEIAFAWQGGEPTLLGLDFFRRVVELQRRHCPAGKRVSNALQTNGTRLDDDWGAFLAEHGFLVGVSVDGPPELHDANRPDAGGAASCHRVLEGVAALRRHRVEFNLLCTVNRVNGEHPLRVYDFLCELGTPFLQFIPIMAEGEGGRPSAESVDPRTYGDFLCAIFDRWVRHDVGRIFVQLFDVQLGILLGMGSSLCVHARECGRSLAIEHSGDVYACDHFVDPEHHLGTIGLQSLAELVEQPAQRAFGTAKHRALPAQCRRCRQLEQCWGGCPKDRWMLSADGEPGLNALCAGYRRFFAHSRPLLERMARHVAAGRPADGIMAELRSPSAAPKATGRNQPCPCGSGRKYKHCHGRG